MPDSSALPETPLAVPPEEAPRLLVLDMTAMGNGTATGEIKSNLLRDWPADRLLQVAKHGKDGLALVRLEDGLATVTPATPEEAAAAIDALEPQAVLYRPVPDTAALHAFAMATIARLGKPLVTWVMDDWPDRLAAEDAGQWARLKPDLEALLAGSALRLSICEAMSVAFEARYGMPFVPLANGVDPENWPETPREGALRLRLRYAGGLAPNMTRESVLRVARAVERLGEAGHDIGFEINTQKWWYEQSRSLFESLKHTRIGTENRPLPDYRRWLAEADALLVAYNFDDATLRYVRYSMANKMPECLASGAAVLAHGPREVATIDYLSKTGAALVVDSPDDEAVEMELLMLLCDPALRADLAAAGRTRAFTRHNLARLSAELRGLVAGAVRAAESAAEAAAEATDPLAQRDREIALLKAQIAELQASLEAALAPAPR